MTIMLVAALTFAEVSGMDIAFGTGVSYESKARRLQGTLEEQISVSSGSYASEISWTLSCDGGAFTLSAGAPYSHATCRGSLAEPPRSSYHVGGCTCSIAHRMHTPHPVRRVHACSGSTVHCANPQGLTHG